MKKYFMQYTKLGFKASGYYKNEKEARHVFKEIYGVEPDEIKVEEVIENGTEKSVVS
jgi:hypothetical protein